jgi:hypothetical protein
MTGRAVKRASPGACAIALAPHERVLDQILAVPYVANEAIAERVQCRAAIHEAVHIPPPRQADGRLYGE